MATRGDAAWGGAALRSARARVLAQGASFYFIWPFSESLNSKFFNTTRKSPNTKVVEKLLDYNFHKG
jgi:hypothetical protein